MQKHAFGKKALTLLLTLCMVFTTIAPAASSVVYADSVSDHTGSSSVSSVDPGNASSVATGGEEQNSGSSSTPTQSQPDSTSNSTSVPAADGGGSDSTSAPPANSSSVPTDNGEETSSSSTSEIPEDSSAPENEDGTGEDESEEDMESHPGCVKKFLWHGSKNENWLNILGTGLKLNPNATITGKMFGKGIYFAPSATKSAGYTSMTGSYWANGRSNRAFMHCKKPGEKRRFNFLLCCERPCAPKALIQKGVKKNLKELWNNLQLITAKMCFCL